MSIESTLVTKVIDRVIPKGEDYNLYTFPIILWIVELHIIIIKSLIELFMYAQFKLGINIMKLPGKYMIYDKYLNENLKEWMPLILFISVALSICGFTLSYLFRTPNYFSDYKILHLYSNFGGITGIWFSFISITYYIYEYSGCYFVFNILLFVTMILGMEKIGEIVNRKLTGIE